MATQAGIHTKQKALTMMYVTKNPKRGVSAAMMIR